MAAGIVVAEPRVLSRVTGTGCGVTGDFVSGAPVAGELELGLAVEPDVDSGSATSLRDAGCSAGCVSVCWVGTAFVRMLGAGEMGADVPRRVYEG